MRKIIIFIADSVPSDEERIEVEGAKVCYRNAKFIDSESLAIESCDYVKGLIPSSYAHLPEWQKEAPTPVGKTKWKSNS